MQIEKEKGMFDALLYCGKILIYKNSNFVCESDKVIGIKKDRIAFLGDKRPDLKAKRTYHLENYLVSPAFVNTHTHLPMSLFRGLADNLALKTWLEDYIFPLEAEMVKEDFVRTATRFSLMELIGSGVTTCCDMYFYNQAIAETIDQAGLRAYVGVGIPSVKSDTGDWREKSLNLKKKFKDKDLIKPALAPHAPYTLDSKTLSQVADFSKKEDIFLTIHVSESLWEQEEIQKKYGKTPVQYLHHLGITGAKSIFAHCVHVNREDLQIMAKTKTSLSYNPESNMKLGNGIAPLNMALEEGVAVGLGTDGSASNNNLNFFEEMGTGAKLQALKYGDQSLTAQQMFQMATIEGARALGLDKDIGTLEEGKKADIIALDLNSSSLQPFYKPISNIVYTALGNEVSFVMCEGQVLMDNFKLKTLNKQEILDESKIFSKQIEDFLLKK